MTMTTKQWHYIESLDLCISIKSSRTPPNTQIHTVYGPYLLIGFKNVSLYGTQGLKYILALMNLGKIDCIIGQHLRDSIEAHKLDIFWSGTLLTNNFPPLPNLTPNSWITNTWRFLFNKNMATKENNPKLKPQCHKDSHIMEDFIWRGMQGE